MIKSWDRTVKDRNEILTLSLIYQFSILGYSSFRGSLDVLEALGSKPYSCAFMTKKASSTIHSLPQLSRMKVVFMYLPCCNQRVVLLALELIRIDSPKHSSWLSSKEICKEGDTLLGRLTCRRSVISELVLRFYITSGVKKLGYLNKMIKLPKRVIIRGCLQNSTRDIQSCD